MRARNASRFANGIISVVLAVFFTVHGTMGTVCALTGYTSPLVWTVWLGVALVAVHVVACIATSRQQLHDTVRPPSAKKKRHLVKKWVTGTLLLAVAAVHGLCMHVYGASAVQAHVSGVVLTAALAAALAAHLCFGSKSLLKDLGIDRRYRIVVRVLACAFAVLYGVGALAAVFLQARG